MSPSINRTGSNPSDPEPIFVNYRVLQALRIQVSILKVRSRPTGSEDLELLFVQVEALLRDIVREAGAA
ncbi:MAG: hypothetical protein O9296_14395 [Novosphingobium sp.]|nr:hypothetical protein [Novosphingobium sp.]